MRLAEALAGWGRRRKGKTPAVSRRSGFLYRPEKTAPRHLQMGPRLPGRPRLSRPAARAGRGTREALLRRRICRGADCGAVFWICRHCDRGHRYCSDRCRQKTRRQQGRDANRRHQKSPEGRLDHRDRQRVYRERCRRRVTDQPSAGRTRSGNIKKPSIKTGISTSLTKGFQDRPRFRRSQTAIRAVCIVCGRMRR